MGKLFLKVIQLSSSVQLFRKAQQKRITAQSRNIIFKFATLVASLLELVNHHDVELGEAGRRRQLAGYTNVSCALQFIQLTARLSTLLFDAGFTSFHSSDFSAR